MSKHHLNDLCPLCGHGALGGLQAACATCPLGAGCGTICCPACGYTTVDASRSGIVRLWKRLRRPSTRQSRTAMTLNDISPGRPARIAGFSDDIAAQQREYLQAFGVVAGRTVRVLQQSPVTVVRIEHLELAIESELAARVTVEAYDPTSSSSDVGIPPPAP